MTRQNVKLKTLPDFPAVR